MHRKRRCSFSDILDTVRPVCTAPHPAPWQPASTWHALALTAIPRGGAGPGGHVRHVWDDGAGAARGDGDGVGAGAAGGAVPGARANRAGGHQAQHAPYQHLLRNWRNADGTHQRAASPSPTNQRLPSSRAVRLCKPWAPFETCSPRKLCRNNMPTNPSTSGDSTRANRHVSFPPPNAVPLPASTSEGHKWQGHD